jgi:hypothetical protein
MREGGSNPAFFAAPKLDCFASLAMTEKISQARLPNCKNIPGVAG